jgi:hypothetical protein
MSVNMLHATRFARLKARYDVDRAVRAVKSPVAPGEVVSLALNEPWLVQAVAALESEFGLFGFVSSAGRPAHPDYASLSLTCNPRMPGDPHLSTLGCPVVSQAAHYFGDASFAVRDSYYDTYGFHAPTPAAKTHLAPLFARMKRSPVRSRLSVIRGGQAAAASFCWGWHKDEPVFENLRVNIHVTASPDHRIQIMRQDCMPTGVTDPRLAQHTFQAGVGYSWDTNLPHRACSLRQEAPDRAAIILGFAPWFDHDPQTDEWVPNGFFGNKHPLQMLLDGDVL